MTSERHPLTTALLVVRVVVYPLGVYFALTRLAPRTASLVLGGFLGASLVLELVFAKTRTPSVVLPPLFVVLLSVASFFLDDPRFLLAQPVAVSLVMLVAFGSTLLRGPPMIERYARMMVSDLSDEEARYCRSVTWVWCGFFVVNGSLLAVSALFLPLWVWALHAGLVSYVAIGVVLLVEIVVRKARFRRYGRGPVDRLFSRVFPPRTLDDRGRTNESRAP